MSALRTDFLLPFGISVPLQCGIIDASAYYAYFAKAEQQRILHKEVHPETGETWVVLDDGALPF